MSHARTFEPWIGAKYETEGLNGLRLLIVGESHYGPLGSEAPDVTRDVVRRLGQEGRHRYFTTVAKLMLGRGSAYISDEERCDFWERVAFTNYIQSFVAETAETRARPTEEMWAAARSPFMETLREAKPDAVLVTGLELHRRIPDIPVRTHAIKHPSQFFRYATWQPGVKAFIESVRSESARSRGHS